MIQLLAANQNREIMLDEYRYLADGPMVETDGNSGKFDGRIIRTSTLHANYMRNKFSDQSSHIRMA